MENKTFEKRLSKELIQSQIDYSDYVYIFDGNSVKQHKLSEGEKIIRDKLNEIFEEILKDYK